MSGGSSAERRHDKEKKMRAARTARSTAGRRLGFTEPDVRVVTPEFRRADVERIRVG